MTLPPAKRPCSSCPYRRDVPAGVWDAEEYAKLPRYDGETFEQPVGVFHCHQQDGRVCAGWVGCHDMGQSLAVRLGASRGDLTPETVDALMDYTTPTPLFATGAEAAAHGAAGIRNPDERAHRLILRLLHKREVRQTEDHGSP